MDDLALNGAMVHPVASFLHQFLQVAIAQRIRRIPAHALQNHILLIVAACKADYLLSDSWYFG